MHRIGRSSGRLKLALRAFEDVPPSTLTWPPRKFIDGEPMKPATKRLLRPVIKIERRAHLLDVTVMHDHDLVGHGHGLDLVMGHIDRRGLEALVQFLHLGAHRDAQFGIEVGERLVEQEHLRIAHDGAAHGDALPLAAGKLARIAVEIGRKAENLRRLADALARSRPLALS